MQISGSGATVVPPAILADAFLSRAAFETQLVQTLPGLRAFALKLTRNNTDSDDLVQEAVAKALRSYRGFQMGTNMAAWAFTILKNQWLNESRRRSSKTEELTDAIVLRNPVIGNQEDSLELRQTLDAMNRLKPVHRQVLTLVRGLGHGYEQAAEIMVCPMGTIKSRLNRADAALRAITNR